MSERPLLSVTNVQGGHGGGLYDRDAHVVSLTSSTFPAKSDPSVYLVEFYAPWYVLPLYHHVLSFTTTQKQSVYNVFLQNLGIVPDVHNAYCTLSLDGRKTSLCRGNPEGALCGQAPFAPSISAAVAAPHSPLRMLFGIA